MNSVNLIGNIALDPELRKTNSGRDVCTLRVGVTRTYRNESGARESDFFNVQCWEQTARFVSTYLKKGDRIGIEGELRERNYKGQDGQQRYTVEVLATKIESLRAKADGPAEERKIAADSDRKQFAEIDDDELPF